MTARTVNAVRANAVAFVALGIALGGTSYAAVTLAPLSVKNRHLAANAVTTDKVKDGSLRCRDLGGPDVGDDGCVAGPQGPSGPQGEQGPAGEPGRPAAFGSVEMADDGSLLFDRESSHNVDLVAHPTPGAWCFDAGVPVSNGTATLGWPTDLHASVRVDFWDKGACPPQTDVLIRSGGHDGRGLTWQDEPFLFEFN